MRLYGLSLNIHSEKIFTNPPAQARSKQGHRRVPNGRKYHNKIASRDMAIYIHVCVCIVWNVLICVVLVHLRVRSFFYSDLFVMTTPRETSSYSLTNRLSPSIL